MHFNETASLRTANGQHPLQLKTARGWWARFRGLMLAAPLGTTPVTQALLIPRCPSVHGFFMRYALDIVYLSRERTPSPASHGKDGYQVTHIARLNPWGISIGRRWQRDGHTPKQILRSAHALELPAGAIATLGIARGDWLEVNT